ncbi:hypothetical protein [Yersinia phage fHe-Yen9-04]|uniref:Uncharacterized protein n=1 Tax=Yersinia phage fHe-Yen9-04 TaxID=2052742 RepID=A0A2C9CXE4_9CAUD|nr:hypothetical protein FDJ41_gp216 [Yersinia phage fHe-Yen9-04]SOK58493.1 hypothetical protein [Yersinia phage fHe-Yen9-04]VUE36262.1 hypothetical protein [Yersinia phage fHe-Yen9-04]
MSAYRIKGAEGVVLDSNYFLELPKAQTKTTTYAERKGMIRYNSEWKAFEGVLEFDDGSVSYRRFANLDENGQLLTSQLPDSVTSGMQYIGTYAPITDDIDPPIVAGQYDNLPVPTIDNSGQYYIVRGLYDTAQAHYKANTPSTSPVIFTPTNPSAANNWIEIKYYFDIDPVTPSQFVVVAAFGRIIIDNIPSTGHEGLLSLATDSVLTAAFTNTNDRSLELALSDSDWIISDGIKQQRLRQNRVSISAGAVTFDRTLMTSTNRSFLSSAGTVQTIIDNLIMDGLRRTGDSMYDDGTIGEGRLGLVYGTATAPSIAFNSNPFDPITNPGNDPGKWSDTQTGIFRPIAGAIGFTSNGTERLRVEPQILKIIQYNTASPATAATVQFIGTGNTNNLGITALNNTFSFSTNNIVQVELTNALSSFHGSVKIDANEEVDGNVVIHGNNTIDLNTLMKGNATVNGNTILGDAGTDTLTVNAASTFVGTTLFSNATNRFALGAVFSPAAVLSFEGTSTATITKTSTELRFNMGAFHDISIYDGAALRTKFNRYGIQLPVLNPIDDAVGVDGMIAYSTERATVVQKTNGSWTTVGSGGGVVTTFTIANWVLNGSNYTYTISNPNIQQISVQELTGSNYSPVDVDSIVISATNAVISIPSTPDLRFNGRVIVQYQ